MTGSSQERQGDGPRLPRLPALDGFRGVALLAVMAFHSGYGWAKGGYLGVTSFFALSGFLITSLVLCERQREGVIKLIAFWARRARRLVPAVLVLLGLVALYIAVGMDLPRSGLLGDGLASAGWVANWHFIFEGESYGNVFASPSPFQHMWSLAIEEQFYLVFPVLALALLGRRGRRGGRIALGVIAALGIVASTFAAAFLHRPGSGPLRAYYGTDARAAEILIGVLLAVVLTSDAGLRRLRPVARWLLDGAGVIALAGLALLMVTLSDDSDRLYRGGFALAALLAAVVVAAATQRGTAISRLLSVSPLVAIGRVSYGAYLFHWPLFLWLTPRRTGLEPAQLFAVRAAATFALAAASYVLIERPIRLGHLPRPVAPVGWATATVGLVGALMLVTTNVVPTTSQLSLSSSAAASAPPPPPPVAAPRVTPTTVPRTGAAAPLVSLSASPAKPKPPPSKGPTATTIPPSQQPVPEAPPPGPPATRVAVVGDSLAVNLAQGLAAWAKARGGDVVVYDLSIQGCPLSRGGERRFPDGETFDVDSACGWWSDAQSERLGRFFEFDPDVVVVQDGFNEVPDRRAPQWSAYRHPGDPVFDTWLLNEYRSALDVFMHDGASVVVTNAVCADWWRIPQWGAIDDADERVAALDRSYKTLSSTNVAVGDFFSYLCPGGRYSDTVDGVEDGRPDGFHLSADAALRVAEKFLGPLVLSSGAGACPRAGSATTAVATFGKQQLGLLHVVLQLLTAGVGEPHRHEGDDRQDDHDRPEPLAPRRCVKFGCDADLLERLASAGGSLRIADPDPEVRHAFRQAIHAVNTTGAAPAGHRIRHTGRNDGPLVIRLEPLEGEPPPKPRSVPVPPRLGRLDPILEATKAAAERGHDGWIDTRATEDVAHVRVARASLQRCLRILQAIVTEARRRGHGISVVTARDCTGGLGVVIGGHPLEVLAAEETQRVPHLPTATELRRRERSSWERTPEWDSAPTGRLSLRLGHGHYASHLAADRVRWKLEDRLGHVFQKLEDHAQELEDGRLAEEQRLMQRRAGEADMAAAREQLLLSTRVAHLDDQLTRFRRADEIRSLVKAARSSSSSHDDDWLAGALACAEEIDPAVAGMRPPPEPEITPEALRPFLRRGNPYGAQIFIEVRDTGRPPPSPGAA